MSTQLLSRASSFPAFLRKRGFRYFLLDRVTSGYYSARDSEWNYSDIPHLNVVHENVDGYPFIVSDFYIASLFVQRLGPFKVPVTVFLKHEDPTEHYYVLNILCIVAEVSTQYINSGTHCITRTKYKFWYKGIVGLIVAFLARISTIANYNKLMSEDVPMRNQRGYLRRLGLRLRLDLLPIIRFTDTVDLSAVNVDASGYFSGLSVCSTTVIRMSGQVDIEEYLLSIDPREDNIYIYPMICEHEGASLRNCPKASRSQIITCPWHGKPIKPLAILPYGYDDSYCIEYLCGRLELTSRFLDNDTVEISLKMVD